MSFNRLTECESSFIIEKSKFISRAYCIADEQNAKQIITDLAAEFKDSTHICWAYVLGEGIARFDDDGEPSGTAGRPILAALESVNARFSMIAVVRYFGGVKLGAGNLTRTYMRAAKLVLKPCECDFFVGYELSCGYDELKNIFAYYKDTLCKIDKIVYNERVGVTVYAPIGLPESIIVGAGGQIDKRLPPAVKEV